MENKRLYGKICAISREMGRRNSALFSGNGVTPVQLHALILLHKAELKGINICQRDIERELSMRPSSVSSMLSNLQNAGYLQRSYAADNARIKLVTLTDSGRELCITNKRMMQKCDGTLQSALTQEEQVVFDGLLDKILAYVAQNKE